MEAGTTIGVLRKVNGIKICFRALPILMMILLTSCSPLQLSPEELMRPPRLTEDQQAIYAALEEFGDKSLVIKYPKRGTYRSAFVMQDIDGDGIEEALVFYTVSDSPYIRLSILAKRGGRWVVTYTRADTGIEIDQISFGNVSAHNGCDIIVGIELGGVEEQEVIVLRYKDEKIVQLFSYPYTEYYLLDITGNELLDIAIINNHFSLTRPTLSIARRIYGDIVDISSQVAIKGGSADYMGLKVGRLLNGVGLYLDQRRGEDYYITEVISYSYATLENKTYYQGNDKTPETFRESELMSSDINNDGSIEVPSVKYLPGHTNNFSDRIYLTEWKRYYEDGFSVISSSINNSEYEFSYSFPKRWVDTVTASRLPSLNEWLFYEYLDDDVENMNAALLRIKAVRVGEYIDKYETEGYIPVGKSRKFEYFAKIYEQNVHGDPTLVINDAEFLSNFSYTR